MQWSIDDRNTITLTDVGMLYYDFANVGYQGTKVGQGTSGPNISVLIDDPTCSDFMKRYGYYMKPYVPPTLRDTDNPPVFYYVTLYISFHQDKPLDHPWQPKIIQKIGQNGPEVQLDWTTIANLGSSKPGFRTTSFVGEGRDPITGEYGLPRVNVIFHPWSKDRQWREHGKDHGVTGYIDGLGLQIKERGMDTFNFFNGPDDDNLPF